MLPRRIAVHELRYSAVNTNTTYISYRINLQYTEPKHRDAPGGWMRKVEHSRGVFSLGHRISPPQLTLNHINSWEHIEGHLNVKIKDRVSVYIRGSSLLKFSPLKTSRFTYISETIRSNYVANTPGEENEWSPRRPSPV